MGFPSEKMEGLYRNPMKEVQRFVNEKHPDAYRIYNLCSERNYDPAKFNHRVGLWPFDDHNPPPLTMIRPFCEDVEKFLSGGENHAAFIHCKAGKGRTGTVICAYLIYSKEWPNADDALDFYGVARTKNGKGVTIPSQRRYVMYWDQIVNANHSTVARTYLLKRIRLGSMPDTDSSGGCDPWFKVVVGHTQVFTSGKPPKNHTVNDDGTVDFEVPPLPLCNDVKIIFYDKDTFSSGKIFWFWFNTAFIEDGKLHFDKIEIDNCHKDMKHHKTFKADFCVDVFFDAIPDEDAGLKRSEAGPANPPE